MVCQHPYGRRRTYKVHNGQVEAECEVCWSCAAVRSQAGGFWLPASYVFQDGNLLELDGRLRIRGYFEWMRQAPIHKEPQTGHVNGITRSPDTDNTTRAHTGENTSPPTGRSTHVKNPDPCSTHSDPA